MAYALVSVALFILAFDMKLNYEKDIKVKAEMNWKHLAVMMSLGMTMFDGNSKSLLLKAEMAEP